jgi:hypothetical protein
VLVTGRTRNEESVPRGGRSRTHGHLDEVSLHFTILTICSGRENDLMSREKLLAKTRAIKVLSYAMQTEAGAANCEKFVEVLGLKTFFPAFMGKVSSQFHTVWYRAKVQGEGKKKKLGATSSFEDEEHLLGILVSLFTNLESDTPPRIRLLAKFVENEYEKVERLLEMREAAEGKLRSVDRDIASERQVRISSSPRQVRANESGDGCE